MGDSEADAKRYGALDDEPPLKKVYKCIRCDRTSTNSLDVCLSTDAVWYCTNRGKPKRKT